MFSGVTVSLIKSTLLSSTIYSLRHKNQNVGYASCQVNVFDGAPTFPSLPEGRTADECVQYDTAYIWFYESFLDQNQNQINAWVAGPVVWLYSTVILGFYLHSDRLWAVAWLWNSQNQFETWWNVQLFKFKNIAWHSAPTYKLWVSFSVIGHPSFTVISDVENSSQLVAQHDAIVPGGPKLLSDWWYGNEPTVCVLIRGIPPIHPHQTEVNFGPPGIIVACLFTYALQTCW